MMASSERDVDESIKLREYNSLLNYSPQAKMITSFYLIELSTFKG